MYTCCPCLPYSKCPLKRMSATAWHCTAMRSLKRPVLNKHRQSIWHRPSWGWSQISRHFKSAVQEHCTTLCIPKRGNQTLHSYALILQWQDKATTVKSSKQNHCSVLELTAKPIETIRSTFTLSGVKFVLIYCDILSYPISEIRVSLISKEKARATFSTINPTLDSQGSCRPKHRQNLCVHELVLLPHGEVLQHAKQPSTKALLYWQYIVLGTYQRLFLTASDS